MITYDETIMNTETQQLLAERLVRRATWPSMHWRTTKDRLDPEQAAAYVKVFLESPELMNLLIGRSNGGMIEIPRPHVPFGPEGVDSLQADADYLREASKRVDQMQMGSNLTATVKKLIEDAERVLLRKLNAQRNRETAGLGGQPAYGYFTVQMSDNAPGGQHCIHLGRYTDTGGLGDNVCGLSRHGLNVDGEKYGFSCSGGWSDPDAFACGGCMKRLEASRAPVGGLFADLFKIAEPETAA